MPSFTFLTSLVADIAKEIDKHYVKNNTNSPPLENYHLAIIEGFKHFVECKLGKEDAIRWGYPNPEHYGIRTLVDSEMEPSILAIYIKKPTKIYKHHIIINGTLNKCWTRFTYVKELCSAFLNHYSDNNISFTESTNYRGSLTNSIEQFNKYDSAGLDNEEIEPDMFAILMATEIMIPPKYRSYTTSLIEKYNKGYIKLYDIAKTLLIPEYVLAKHIESNFYSLSTAVYDKTKWD